MVTLAAHELRMNDRAAQERKISAEFADLRAPHLQDLDALEDVVRAACPLPASYDVTRLQPAYFFEFTYTELLGGIYLSPQSSEIAARVIEEALLVEPRDGFDPVPAIMSRRQMDKYTLAEKAPPHKRVAFVTGSNIFAKAVCKEALTRAMHDDPDLVIKPHPLTSEDTLRTLGRLYGYHRILDPRASGWACLEFAEEILTCSTSEMGLYAVLLGKPIQNITKVGYEALAAYGAIYLSLWGKSPTEAKATLERLLKSPVSGFIHPDDPAANEKAGRFASLAMSLREPFKPRFPIDPAEYADFLLHGARRPGKDTP